MFVLSKLQKQEGQSSGNVLTGFFGRRENLDLKCGTNFSCLMAASQLNSVLSEVLEVYKNLGIHQLAEYQRGILEDLRFYPPDLNNLLISAPTASGKNLVVEILALVNVRLTNKKCMFVGPYVAACREVFFNLQVLI